MSIGEVTPCLFVGLGGSGGKVMKRVASMVQGREDYARRFANLSKFVVLDTDQAAVRDARSGDGPVIDETILISAFDKQGFVSRVRGDDFSLEDEFFTQWLHPDYVFRAGDTAGAGQIRLESRLGLMHSLSKGDLHARMTRVLEDLRRHVHTGANVDTSIQVHVCFSVAGGTGSGGFLSFAYFLRGIAERERIPLRIIGYALQPHIMESVVGANFDDICANGYASFKELEEFNKISVDGQARTFHYDDKRRMGKTRTVGQRPFDITYLIDEPAAFHEPNPENAAADCIYFQVYSPFGETQASDVDNYDKEKRQLFPSDLSQETKQGYTAFYGSLGMCALNVPDDDIQRYCAIRFSSDAIRRELLLDDPDLVPGEKVEKFKSLIIPAHELAQLSDEERKRREDEVFARKIDMICEDYADRPETFWGRLLSATAGVSERFDEELAEMVDKVARPAGDLLHGASGRDVGSSEEFSHDRLVERLRRDAGQAQRNLDMSIDAEVSRTSGDWWMDFLASAGPASSPALNPYEQRYALLLLVGSRSQDAPLSGATIRSAQDSANAAARTLRDESFDDFNKTMETAATSYRESGAASFWQRTLKGDQVKAQEAEAKTSVVKRFNSQVEDLRGALKVRARTALLDSLFESAQRLLDTFRDIDRRGAVLSEDLLREAEDYRRSGDYEEVLPGGGRVRHHSEANQYTIDEEALLSTNHERMWNWYYEDQIRPVVASKASEALQMAFTEVLKPSYDDQGRRIHKNGDDVVRELAGKLRALAEADLTTFIKSDNDQGGLLLDQAIALEFVYDRLINERSAGDLREKLDTVAEKYGAPLSMSKIWAEPSALVYARKKLDAAVHKASLLGHFEPGKAHMKYARTCLAGVSPHYRETGPFTDVVQTVLPAETQVEGWHDAKRIVLYHYLVGVPLYTFPKVVDELQTAYRTHQDKDHKAWPLHVDVNFEDLPDLDPQDIREDLDRQATRVVPLLIAEKIFGYDAATGTISFAVEGFAIEWKSLSGVGEWLREMKRALAMDELPPGIHQYETTVQPLIEKLEDNGVQFKECVDALKQTLRESAGQLEKAKPAARQLLEKLYKLTGHLGDDLT